MKNTRNKKTGSLTATQIAIVTLIIVGFILLLFLLYRFLMKADIDRDVCHESVILRGTVSSLSGLMQDYIPLKCKTAKFCITAGNGKCDKEGEAFSGETGITKVKVQDKEQIEKFLAGEIIDCWSMLGEGKVDLFSQWIADNYGFDIVYPTCVICSRIAYDKKSLEDAGIDLSKINLLTYMTSHKVPDKSVSYFDYLAGENGKLGLDIFNSMIDVSEEETAKLKDFSEKEKIVLPGTAETEDYSANELENSNKDTGEMSVLFMQISAPSAGEVLKNTAELALGATGITAYLRPSTFKLSNFITAPRYRKLPAGQILTIGNKVYKGGQFAPKTLSWKATNLQATKFAKVAAAIAVLTGIVQQGFVAENRALTASKCGDISTGTEARDGCSVVRTVNYNVSEINTYCSWIESIP